MHQPQNLTSDGTSFTIEHEQVLRTDPNNSEIRYKKLCILRTDPNNSELRYKKLCIFLTGGAYAPYAPCMSTPLPPAFIGDPASIKTFSVCHTRVINFFYIYCAQ